MYAGCSPLSRSVLSEKPTAVAEIKDKYFEMYRGKASEKGSAKGAGCSTDPMDVDG